MSLEPHLTRIRATEFFRNPERTMKPVIEKLQSLDIPVEAKPRLARKNAASQAQPLQVPLAAGLPSQGLVDRVIARAEELLASWAAPQESAGARRRESRQAVEKD